MIDAAATAAATTQIGIVLSDEGGAGGCFTPVAIATWQSPIGTETARGYHAEHAVTAARRCEVTTYCKACRPCSVFATAAGRVRARAMDHCSYVILLRHPSLSLQPIPAPFLAMWNAHVVGHDGSSNRRANPQGPLPWLGVGAHRLMKHANSARAIMPMPYG